MAVIYLISTLLFIGLIIALFHAGFSYASYRSLLPEPEAPGLLSQIRGSLRLHHDPARASDECKEAFVRFKKAAACWILMFLTYTCWVLIVGALGLVKP